MSDRPRLTRPHRQRPVVMVLLAATAVLLTACSGAPSPGAIIEWRELTIDLPDGWVELDRTESSLVVGDGPGSTEPGERGDLFVATQFTHEPGATADDWRRFVDEQGAELEADSRTTVATLPAITIQFSFTTNDIPTRERVVVIPSREIVVLQQPVPMQGETDGPEWFDDHLDEFDALLEGIVFGAPSRAE